MASRRKEVAYALGNGVAHGGAAGDGRERL